MVASAAGLVAMAESGMAASGAGDDAREGSAERGGRRLSGT